MSQLAKILRALNDNKPLKPLAVKVVGVKKGRLGLFGDACPLEFVYSIFAHCSHSYDKASLLFFILAL